MAALPYMQLYVAEYLADTMHLDALESGAYLHLLMNYWQTGKPLADDDKKLARIAKCSDEQWLNIRSTIVVFFANKGGFWKHKRVENDLESVRAKSAARASAGRQSGRIRAAKTTGSNICSTNDPTNHPTKSNYIEQDTDTDTDSEQEQKEKDRGAPSAPATKAPAISRETDSGKGRRLSENWVPPRDLIEWAMEVEQLTEEEASREADKFRDYWLAESARRAVKRDWDRAFKNWLRNARDLRVARPPRANGGAGSGYRGPVDPVEIGNRLLREHQDADDVPPGGRLLRSA